ncbi:MAG: hypothetical protein IPG63_13385 [Xanthomonadales bacterium]|nr:hypothetical protein [Xanthomonadales bacterium]MBK7146669.1 hypothetical protein [Xanthomonadales bacterium]MCC6560031.1 hypothetical protein [Xanthomonadales bacterium]
MRQVYASPRNENVDRVEAMLNEAGIGTRVVNRDKLRRGNFRRFSFQDPGHSKDWPAVQVLRAEDMPRAREMLRAAGLMGSTRPDAETPMPRWEAPGNIPDQMAARMRRLAMIGVLFALILLAWAYSSGQREAALATPAAVVAPAVAPPVEDNTVILLDDSAPGTAFDSED